MNSQGIGTCVCLLSLASRHLSFPEDTVVLEEMLWDFHLLGRFYLLHSFRYILPRLLQLLLPSVIVLMLIKSFTNIDTQWVHGKREAATGGSTAGNCFGIIAMSAPK